jgi:hypothetical protein
MHVAQNDEIIPEPYGTILLEINRSLPIGKEITLEEVRGAVRICFSRQYNKTTQDLMTGISKFADRAGFSKRMKQNVLVVKVGPQGGKHIEEEEREITHFIKVNECTVKKKYERKLLACLLAPFLAIIPFVSMFFASGAIHFLIR